MRLLTRLASSAESSWKETQRTTQIPLSSFGTPASTPSTIFLSSVPSLSAEYSFSDHILLMFSIRISCNTCEKRFLSFSPDLWIRIFGKEGYRNFHFQQVTPMGDFYPLFYIGSQVFSLLGACNILVLQLKYEFNTSWETPVTSTPSASSPTGDAWIFCGLVSKG